MAPQSDPPDFQTIIFNLQTYWANHGCLIWQPYYSQVGAGTMNPATFLRVLGPEPWKVAYVEPSVRPDDGRYGQNPNRLQQFYQFQVILKPDPGNPQELYLDSLLALGIDPKQHDIRFVEDNWESPALSAWGLGWEVWMDGLEITQFTYFQQDGGIALEVPSIEITYGLERLAMALQRVRDFKQIRWNDERSYGDVYQVAEREHSTYYYEVADVTRMRELFRLYEAEANLGLEKGLVLPAYDNVIKCSHIFNILDARGAVGFTERQTLFGKMRELSHRVAETYLAQRSEMGFPWLKTPGNAQKADLPALPQVNTPKADFLLEIGTEEMPVGDLEVGINQLRSGLRNFLDEARLAYDELLVNGTPRRLVAIVRGLQTTQQDRLSEVKGPSADHAFDAQGNPTKAAEGFARSRGVAISALQIKETEGGRYVVAQVVEPGKNAAQILTGGLPGILAGIRFTKTMRWDASGVSFSRPVRWLVAMLGESVLPFSFAGLISGNITRGMRFSDSPEKTLRGADDYLAYLASEGIVLSVEERQQTILERSQALAASVDGVLPEESELLKEVANLVESPLPLLGSFEERYLESLPPEVIIAVMKKHQRYFPVLDAQGHLTRHFIIVRNGGQSGDEVVVDGNLQVVHARFADAEFFIREDQAKSLEDFVSRLDQLTFQTQLGSMLAKTERIEALTRSVGRKLHLEEADQKIANRVSHLCKADLASEMVVEMTELQGVMGRIYALRSGEEPAVAEGILEHYLPRNAEDALPATPAGLVVGIADRLDSIAGLFAVGLAPTGNKDPFALRRTALGLVQLLIGKNLDFDLEWGLGEASRQLPVDNPKENLWPGLDFIIGRLRGLLLERGFRYDVVEAVIKPQGSNPAAAFRNAKILSDWVSRVDWTETLPAYSRCVRITRSQEPSYEVDETKLSEPEEKALYTHVLRAEEALTVKPDLDVALTQVRGLVAPINAFFDKVLVMDEDVAVRKTRMALLQKIVALLSPYADLSALEGF